MSWFKTGEEGIKEKKRLDKEAELRKEKYVPRFWLKKGEKARVIFLDDEGFYCHVHQLNIGGSWDNYITCTNEFKPCPLCEDGNRPTFVGHYSIIDLREYTKKDGTVVKYSKRIFPAKSSVIQRLYDLKKKYGTLVGRMFEITRYDNDPNCGGSVDYIGKVKGFETKFSKEERTPFDYKKVLAPPTDEELKQLGFSTTGEVFGEDEEVVDEVINAELVEDLEEEAVVDEEVPV